MLQKQKKNKNKKQQQQQQPLKKENPIRLVILILIYLQKLHDVQDACMFKTLSCAVNVHVC